MAIELSQIGNSFAREVRNLALWSVADPQRFAEIRQAWGECGVLVFRKQSLSEDELVAFSSGLGLPERIVRSDWASRLRPEVTYISNLRDQDGSPIGGLGANELDWHTDQSYMANPATGALLYGVEIPRAGGATYWANLALAYAALPDALKTAVAGRQGIFSYAKRSASYVKESQPDEDIRRKTPDVLHPLVHVHPLTGRKALYIDPATMDGIEGMPMDESRALLTELAAHATRPEFVYRHEWQPGDAVLWDNGVVLHRRDTFDASERRLLKRTTFRLPAAQHIIPGESLAA